MNLNPLLALELGQMKPETRIYTILKGGRVLMTVRVPITEDETKNVKKALELSRLADFTDITVSR